MGYPLTVQPSSTMVQFVEQCIIQTTHAQHVQTHAIEAVTVTLFSSLLYLPILPVLPVSSPTFPSNALPILLHAPLEHLHLCRERLKKFRRCRLPVPHHPLTTVNGYGQGTTASTRGGGGGGGGGGGRGGALLLQAFL